MSMTVFCVKCRTKIPIGSILDKDVVSNGNRFRLTVICPNDGVKVNRFVSRKDVELGKQGSGILGNILGKLLGTKPLFGRQITGN